MNKFLMSLVFLGSIVTNSIAAEVDSGFLILDKFQDGKMHMTAYDNNGSKKQSFIHTPRLTYDSPALISTADDVVNAVCQGKKVYEVWAYNFLCGDDENRYDFLQLLINADIRVTLQDK